MQSILFLIFLLCIWIDSQNLQFLFMKVSLINGALFGLGFVGFAGYLIDLTKIKISQYYHIITSIYGLSCDFSSLLAVFSNRYSRSRNDGWNDFI